MHKMYIAASAALLAMSLVLVSTLSTNNYLEQNIPVNLVSAHHAGKVLGATTPPTVSITSPGNNQAIDASAANVSLEATTDDSAICKYSTSPGQNFNSMAGFSSDAFATTTHATLISPLSPGSSYTLYVKCQNTYGYTSTETNVNFRVSLPAAVSADTTAPQVSSVSISDIGSSTVTISWNTDEASDSQIEYGPISAYGSLSSRDSSLTTSHKYILSGLNGNTSYHFRVRSRDSSGNLGVSDDALFYTIPAPLSIWTNANSNPPQIYNGTIKIYGAYAAFISKTSATIYWQTDKISFGTVRYGSSTSYTSSSSGETLLVNNHGQDVTNLTPGTTYHYQITSSDYSGNYGLSGDGTFTTLSDGASPTPTPAVTPTPASSSNNSFVNFSGTAKVVLPSGAKNGDIVKFKNSPAIYLVKPDGLYAFSSYGSYTKYVKKSRKKLKTYKQTVAAYTVQPGSASDILGY